MEHWCNICHGIGKHLPECPFYEREAVCRCESCDDVIHEGDEVFNIDGVMYHRECFEDDHLTTA